MPPFNAGTQSQEATAVKVDHQHCRMGKWYQADGLALFGHLPSYRALEQPHQQVHHSVHQMLDSIVFGTGNVSPQYRNIF